ncbi:MAG TPA: hypothetical protein PKL78_13620 [Anaerolineales bacterium]|nr:hypothetical protein [Anaerolineales bacterium]HNO30854.1 hypothetical protein [Anaerolineales bacterium]
MNRLVLLAGLISIALGGCSLGATPLPPTPTLVPPTQALPTLTPIPPTPTPAEVIVQVTAELVNCRLGPGTIYGTVNEIQQGKSLRAVGRNESSTWWYIKDPGNPAGFCWVSADVTDETGDTAPLSIIPAPAANVTDVVLRVEPSRIVVNCDQFPQTVFFEAQVTIDGPALFTWKWEASTGAISDMGTLIFEEAGTQVINEYYQINAPNEYWVKLHILTPSDHVEQVNFPVSCTP